MTVCSFSSFMLFPRFLLSSHRQTVHFTPVICVLAICASLRIAHFHNCRFYLLRCDTRLHDCLDELFCRCFDLDFRSFIFLFSVTPLLTVALSAACSIMPEISFSVFPAFLKCSITFFTMLIIPILSRSSFPFTQKGVVRQHRPECS